MPALIHFINTLAASLFAWLLWPFRGLSEIWPLLILSALSGVFMVWIFKLVSDQRTIRRIRERIRGNLLAVRLYRHDIGVVLKLQGSILTDTLSYLRLSLVPMLILAIPVVLILAQLNLYFSVRPLRPQEPALFKLKLADNASLDAPISLKAPPEVTLETPAVRISRLHEVVWRIRPVESGRHVLTVDIAGEKVEKTVVSGNRWEAVPTVRTSGALNLLLYPGEAPLNPAQTLKQIEVTYPTSRLYLFDFQVHWLVLFLIVSIAVGFSLKRVIGVEI